MKRHLYLAGGRRGPWRFRFADETELVVERPVSLRRLPPDPTFGRFHGIAAVLFDTPRGRIAAFLHDLDRASVDALLDSQRREAEAQLGIYAMPRQWWEDV